MFQQPLEQTQSLPQVEDIFVSSSPRPRLTLNRGSEWWSIGCWLRTSQYKWHPRPMPCHLWREMKSLHTWYVITWCSLVSMSVCLQLLLSMLVPVKFVLFLTRTWWSGVEMGPPDVVIYARASEVCVIFHQNVVVRCRNGSPRCCYVCSCQWSLYYFSPEPGGQV